MVLNTYYSDIKMSKNIVEESYRELYGGIPNKCAIWRMYDQLTNEQKKDIIHNHRTIWIKVRNSFYGSKEWRAFRLEILKIKSCCEICESVEHLSIHHAETFHMDVYSLKCKIIDMMKQPENFEVLCEDCHLLEHYDLLYVEVANDCYNEKQSIRLLKALITATVKKDPLMYFFRYRDVDRLCKHKGWLIEQEFWDQFPYYGYEDEVELSAIYKDRKRPYKSKYLQRQNQYQRKRK